LTWSEKLIPHILHDQSVSEAQETKFYQKHLEYLKIFMQSHNPGFIA